LIRDIRPPDQHIKNIPGPNASFDIPDASLQMQRSMIVLHTNKPRSRKKEKETMKQS